MRDALGRVQSLLLVGGSSEIGLAIVRRIPRAPGAVVRLAGPDRPEMEQVAASLREEGIARVEIVDFDACDTGDQSAVIARAFADEPDVVVVATGFLGDQAMAERDPDAAARIVDINFRGLVPVLVGAADRLRSQGHGTLVVMSTVAGERPRPANFIYGSAKAGLDALARGLTGSLAGSGASVVIVRPGFVRTRMTSHLKPAPFATTPDAVADAVVAALPRGSRIIWVPGILRWVMLVLRHLPEAVFRRLPGG
jgi:decaprenylphospho-beta-D-erythro-pentofuranosid-2-ulose 2-reductase